MKCPRNKFKGLDYSQVIADQKKEICKGCEDYKGESSSWGEHCRASLICLITGKKLSAEAFDRIPKEQREKATHTLSDEGRKEFIKRINDVKKNRNLPLW